MWDLPGTPPYDAVIKHDFAGGEGLLAVQLGDAVRVTNDAGTGWLHGTKTDGAAAWLPKSYAGPVPPAAPPPAALPPTPRWYSEQDSGSRPSSAYFDMPRPHADHGGIRTSQPSPEIASDGSVAPVKKRGRPKGSKDRGPRKQRPGYEGRAYDHADFSPGGSSGRSLLHSRSSDGTEGACGPSPVTQTTVEGTPAPGVHGISPG